MYSVIQDLAQSSAQASGSGPAWEMAGVIAAAGAFGGLVNALLNSGNGFSIKLPRRGTNDVFQLGTVGNLVLGIAAEAMDVGGQYQTQEALHVVVLYANAVPVFMLALLLT